MPDEPMPLAEQPEVLSEQAEQVLILPPPLPGSQGGRPTKFTPEARERILDAIGRGATRESAAAAAGVHPSILYRWLKRGRKQKHDNSTESEFCEFCEALKKREAEFLNKAIGRIISAGKKNWTALAWWAERRYPAQWGDQRKAIAEAKRRIAELEKIIDGLVAKLGPRTSAAERIRHG
jgi:transposase-like protein